MRKLLLLSFLLISVLLNCYTQAAEYDRSHYYPLDTRINYRSRVTGMIKKGVGFFNRWIALNRESVKKNKELERLDLKKMDLSFINLEKNDISNTFFNASKLVNANFEGSDISFSSFKYADLRRVNFDNVTITYCNFSYANLSGVKFRTKHYIANTIFIKANLENADFSKALFATAEPSPYVGNNNFSGANLKGANLSDKSSSDISRTSFLRSNLENTNFRNSYPTSCDFRGAYLKGADFTGADLEGAIFEKRWKPYLSRFKSTIKHWRFIKWVDNGPPYNPYLSPALVAAVRKGDYALSKSLLERGADYDAIANGVPALTWACYKGNLRIVRLLISKGAYINIIDKDGDTPLIAAVFAGRIHIVKYLLGIRGIKVNVKNFSGHTAYSTALKKGNAEIIRLLKARGAR